jgi:ech hydrogenase subunit E
MASVVTLAVGHQLADIPMILAGVDPCFSCNDRAIAIHRTELGKERMSWQDLRQYGIDFYKVKGGGEK